MEKWVSLLVWHQEASLFTNYICTISTAGPCETSITRVQHPARVELVRCTATMVWGWSCLSFIAGPDCVIVAGALPWWCCCCRLASCPTLYPLILALLSCFNLFVLLRFFFLQFVDFSCLMDFTGVGLVPIQCCFSFFCFRKSHCGEMIRKVTAWRKWISCSLRR